MKHIVYFNIAARLIILFTTAILLSFIPEHLRGFFGDIYLPDGTYGIDPKWDWGARHYWYFWLMVCLFLLSGVNLVMFIVNIIKKHYEL